MKYELWKDNDSLSFFPEDNDSARQLLEPDAILIKIIEAEDWTQAMIQYHKYMGWEPYKPF